MKPGLPNGGLLVEALRLDEGQLRPLDGYWSSKNNGIAIGDVPPGSFGHAAARLDGAEAKAHLRFPTHYQRYGQTNGTWHVDFWAKAKAGAPRLKVTCDRDEWGGNRTLDLTPAWKKYRHDLIETGRKSPCYRGNVLFHAGGQAANSWLNRSIVRDTPNADRFAVAPTSFIA